MEPGDSYHHGANLHNVLDNKEKMTAENPFSSEFIHEADMLERSSSRLGNSNSLLSTPQPSLVLPNSPFDYQHNFSNDYGASSSGVNRNRDDFDEISRQTPNGLDSDVELSNCLAGQKDKVSVDRAMLDLPLTHIVTSAFEAMNLGDRIASNPNCNIFEQASCSLAFSPDRTRGKQIAEDDQQQIEANGFALEPVNARVCHPISQRQFYTDAAFREPWHQQCEFNQQYYTDETAGEGWYRHCSFEDEERYTSQPQHLFTQQLQNQSSEHVLGSRSYFPTSISYGSAQGNANHYDTANVVNRNYNSSELGRCLCEYGHLLNSSLVARQLERSPAYDQCPNLVFPRGNRFTGNFEDKYMYDSFDNSFRELRISENAPDGLVFREGSHEEDNEMFDNLIDDVVGLMTNSSWSSLVQKIVKKCNEEQLKRLVERISRNGFELLKLCCNHHATRVVQKIIEKLRRAGQYRMIVVALKPHVVTLIKDSNGSHVAECCFKFPPEYREPLFEDAVTNCVELARDGQGCCVLQKYMELVEGDQKFLLLRTLTSNAFDLSQDPSGNYVVQHIMEQEISWATNAILDQLEGCYALLSLQKVASHVVERCLIAATGERLDSMIMELIRDPRTLLYISQNQYGNYVIQTARKQCTGALLAAFREAIRLLAPALGSNPYGRKVLASINRK
ncbi:pumilio homolog 15-like [Zingiber officinale]|uniref:pumilio homolog 15-like n=1 Tax=Zingiber officinale TaxID=94328 RepID=UPI001C4B877E|nr:pumilio homolog 15-like [Zingiber officinale]